MPTRNTRSLMSSGATIAGSGRSTRWTVFVPGTTAIAFMPRPCVGPGGWPCLMHRPRAKNEPFHREGKSFFGIRRGHELRLALYLCACVGHGDAHAAALEHEH